MSGVLLGEAQEGMSQEPSTSPRSHPRLQPSPEHEYEVAPQLIEHSNGGRAVFERGLSSSSRLERDALASNLGTSPNRDGLSRTGFDDRQRQSPSSQIVSEDRTSDGPYGPLSNPPAAGQICRWVLDLAQTNCAGSDMES